jgi:hypothetical protein
MKSEPQYLSTGFPPEMFHRIPVKVKNKLGQIEGHLEVEKENGKGELMVSAHYDSSPFRDEPHPAKFYLTQEQLDDFEKKGAMCVLNAPAKSNALPI